MNTESQRITIASFMGFRRIGMIEGSPNLMGELPPTRGWIEIPDYPNDLNAMHEAEQLLSGDQADQYGLMITTVMLSNPAQDMKHDDCDWHATAAQRAEAFLRTVGKWIDSTTNPRE